MPLNRRNEDIELRRSILEMRKSVKCLHDNFKIFSDKYEGYLERVMETNQFWGRVREQVIAGTAKSIVWAMITGFAIAVWFAIKEYLARK